MAPIVLQPTGHAYTDAAHWKAVGTGLLSEGLQAEFELTDGETNRPVEAKPEEDPGNDAESVTGALNKWTLAFLVPLYFLSLFLATFFNVAFYNEIINALNGKPVSIRGGLSFAMSRAAQILRWSILAGSVGCILKALEEHLGFVGDRIVRAIGLTWSIACVLVVPVIVRDNAERNPMAYLKCAAGVIRQTWGEALVGFIGLRGVPILFFAGFGMLWIVSLIVAFFTMVDRPMLALAIGGEFFIGLPSGTVLSYLCGMIQKIYIGAL